MKAWLPKPFPHPSSFRLPPSSRCPRGRAAEEVGGECGAAALVEREAQEAVRGVVGGAAKTLASPVWQVCGVGGRGRVTAAQASRDSAALYASRELPVEEVPRAARAAKDE